MTVHVIVGSGFAGLKAAETIRQIDSQATVIILTEETDLPYWRPRLPDIVANKVTADKILVRSAGFLAEHRIEVRLGQRVTALVPRENRLTLGDGLALTYDQLLVATGSWRRPGGTFPATWPAWSSCAPCRAGHRGQAGRRRMHGSGGRRSARH